MGTACSPLLSNSHRELLPLLYSHCRSLFSGSRLPSHDHDHHLRVWNFAMDLLCELSEKGRELNADELTNLMLAVFFHDTGLTRTLDINHGRESRKFCEDFLEKTPVMSPESVAPALHAIEFHDQKETPFPSGRDSAMDILGILTVCDDADAYGPAGILRYAEIYLLRDITTGSLAKKVLKNMEYRFDFLTAQEWIPEKFFVKHMTRYRYAAEFYRSLQSNINSGNKVPAELAIIDSYMEHVYHGTCGFREFALKLMKSSCSKERMFGIDLSAELK